MPFDGLDAILSKKIISFQKVLENSKTLTDFTEQLTEYNRLKARELELKERELRLKELELGINSGNKHFTR